MSADEKRTPPTIASPDSQPGAHALSQREEEAVRALIKGRLAHFGVKGRWSVRLEEDCVVLESYTHDWTARTPLRRPRSAED